MAAQVDALGTHIRRAGAFRERQQIDDRAFEFRREHVVRIVAEALASQRDVWRFVENALPVAAQGFHPHVVQALGSDRRFQGLAIEVRKPPRHWKSADIDERFNLMDLERCNQLLQSSRGMSDRVEGRQRMCTAQMGSGDAFERGRDRALLLRKYGSQVEQHATFFDAGDDRRIRFAQARANLIGTLNL